MKKRLLVVAVLVTVLLSALPAAAQDAVKAEIRQAIDVAYLNALNTRDIKTFLAGWHEGALVASLSPTGEVSYQPVIDFANAAAKDNVTPPEKKEFTYLYPAIDVTGNIGMAHVEVMRGEAVRFTGYLPVVKTRNGWKMAGYTFYLHEKGARPETAAGEADAVKKVVEDTLVRGLMQNSSKEQVLAGISPGCEVSQYDPERDIPPGWGMPNGVLTKVKLPPPEFKAGSGGYDYMAGKATSSSRPLPRRHTQLYIVYGDKELPALREGLAKYRPILEALRSKTCSVTIEDLPEEGHVPNGSLAKGLKHVFGGYRQPS